jgi:hypothetical protein
MDSGRPFLILIPNTILSYEQIDQCPNKGDTENHCEPRKRDAGREPAHDDTYGKGDDDDPVCNEDQGSSQGDILHGEGVSPFPENIYILHMVIWVATKINKK